MKRIYSILFILLAISVSDYAQVSKSTFIYAVKESDTLRLDRYTVPTNNRVKPCVIFMFGGGFVGGQRDAQGYPQYFTRLAKGGYDVVSIDYRVGLRNVMERMRHGEKIKKLAFPGLLANAIDTAVVDLYDATNYVIAKSTDWHIDTTKIIINGSSAGAISVLQAEYYLCSNNKLTQRLPAGFNYGGVISFAGAVFSTHGALHWDKHPAPIQFFHGDADNRVPYNKLRLLKYGFYGSKELAKQLAAMNSPYYFYDVEDADHQMAVVPMEYNISEIEEFIYYDVKQKRQLKIHTQVAQIGKPKMKKNFGLKDYLMNNFR